MTLRMLLASTALAGLLAGGAFAQDAAAPAANSPAAMTSTEPMQAGASGDYVQRQEANQYLASNLTGTDVYETNAPDARAVGEIRNFVVDKDAKIAAVVIATSGLDNNKTIAAPSDKLEWMAGQDGAMRAVLKAPVAEFQNAPEFTGQSRRDAAANGAMMPGSGAASTPAAGAMAPGADTAMAPATGAMAPTGNAMAPGGAMTGDTAAMSGTGAMMPVPGATPSSGTPSDSVAATSTTQAAGASNTADMAAGTAAPAAPAAAPMPAANGYFAALADGQELSDEIIGSNVYSGPGDDAETIGSVNDLVLTGTGDVPAAVIGVGGFLGLGEKNVGVPFARLQMAQAGADAQGRLVLAATKDQLQAAPAFEEREERTAAATPAANGMGTDNAMPGGGAMANGGAMATGTGVAPVTGSMAANDPMQQQGTVAPGSTVADGNAMAGGAMASGAAAGGAMAGGGAMANADPSTTSSTSADQRSTMQPVTGPELTADNHNGVTVYGPNDQSIGSVGDIALSADGRVDAIVVDVGGFLGIGSKPVAVAMDNLQFLRDANGRVNVYTQFTSDQLKNAPAFDRETYTQNRDSMRLTQSGAAQPAQ